MNTRTHAFLSPRGSTDVDRKRGKRIRAAVNKSLDHLCALGVTWELTGQQRHRLFSYEAYMSILNEGAEPPGGVAQSRKAY